MSTILAYQGRAEERDSLDDFPTPPWATRALCQFLLAQGLPLSDMTCREPAANRGFMVRALREEFKRVYASDILDYGGGFRISDFLRSNVKPVDFTVTNPPYVKAEEFVQRMIETSLVGCAVLIRTAFFEGKGRYERVYSRKPPAFALQFVERVAMKQGLVDRKAKSAVPYSWLVWIKGNTDTRLRWIAPCRVELEKERDYE